MARWVGETFTVTQLVTSVPTGFSLICSNPEPGTPGVATGETEASFRARVLQAGLAASQGMARYLKTLLGQVAGVQPRLISVIQVPDNGGWEIVVGGGDPYAVAYAIWLGVKKITLFGCDFTYPNAHDAEKGRACVEFWLGIATERGIEISVPKTTSLLDAMYTQAARFYGYDCVELCFERSNDGIKVKMTEKTELPGADEIEEWYDHSAHPNGMVTN